MTRPLSTWRAISILTRMAALRLRNRLGGQLTRWMRRPPPSGQRVATPRRRGPARWLLALFAVVFLVQGVSISTQLVHRLGRWADARAATAAAPGPGLQATGVVRLHMLPGPEVWSSPAGEPALLGALALLAAILSVSLLCTSLGTQNQDLGKVEWNVEWLFTFPLTTRSLYLAKILETSLLSVFSWFTFFPLLITVFWSAGYAAWAIPVAAAATWYQNLLIAAVRVVLENWLRTGLALSRIKNLQALATVLGILSLYVVIYLAIQPELPRWFAATAEHSGPVLRALPSGLVLLLCAGGGGALAGAGALLAVAAAFVAGGTLASAWRVRGGLIASTGPYQGPRRSARPAGSRDLGRFLAGGVVGKELRLLLRDRNFFVQTLVVPLLIIGFQLVINPEMIQVGVHNVRHGATLAFGIGTYILMFGGFSVLYVEARGLWLLYTVPRRLDAIMREKALLWAGVSLLYVTAILATMLALGGDFDAELVVSCCMALLGVVIYAFIATGMGVLGTDPLEQQSQRKIRPGMAYLYMLLASLYASGIYARSSWTKIVLILLCSLLAYAIWQKVRERIPYLLDPAAAPRPTIALADGLIAVLCFFVIQGLVNVFFVSLGVLEGESSARSALAAGPTLLLSYATAGGVVVAGSLLVLWRRKVPGLRDQLGLHLRAPRGKAAAALTTLAAAGFAGAVALAWTEAVRRIPFLSQKAPAGGPLSGILDDPSTVGWVLGLAVVAAPCFEEFIFRGMVYRGLRRSRPALGCALLSAALFAIVHPPLALPPVFALGVAAALLFEYTGTLVAPIACHALYNAGILACAWALDAGTP